MAETHGGPGGRTFIGTVVFVDIVEYSRTLVTQQVELKTHFAALLGRALEPIPAGERMVLDTGDGAAVCFLGDPEDALFAGNTLCQAAAADPGRQGLRLRIGINLGPVKIVKDVNGNPNILGDGINDAQRVMSFAAPGQILVSRSFYEVVSRLSQEYAHLFQFAGVRKDKHIREHEVYEVNLAHPRGGGGTAGVLDPYEAAPVVQARPAGPVPGLALAPETLQVLVAALAQHVGPVAKLLVRREADRALDLDGLCHALGAHVPEASRGEFVGRAGAAVGRPAGGRPAEAPAAPADRPADARAFTPEDLAVAERRLARYIGPLARVLVRNAARQAATPRELYRSLAVHIDDPAARTAFVDSAGRPG